MIRTIIQRLTTDVGALRAENVDLRAELEDMRGRLASSQNAVAYNDRRVDEVYEEVYALRAENDRLRTLAGNTEATPAERTVLDVVATMPGATANEIGKAASIAGKAKLREEWTIEHPNTVPSDWMYFMREPSVYDITGEAKHLTSLHKKGLVRRERAGQSYRYWPVGGGE